MPKQRGDITLATALVSDQKLDIGSVLQRSLGVLGNRAGPFALLAIILSGVPTFLSYYFLLDNLAAPELIFVTPSYWIMTLVGMVTSAILQAVIIRETILYINDRAPAVGESIATALRKLLPIIAIAILTTLAAGVGFLFLIVPGVIIYLGFAVSVPVLVEEDLGVTGSMQRSWQLTRGSRWRILGLFLIILVAYLVISMVMGLLTFVTGPMTALMNAILGVIFALSFAVAAASLYVELRLIRDGATVEGLGAIFD